MSANEDRVPVPGSERHPLHGARAVGAPDPEERIEVTVLVRRRPSSEGLAATLAEMGERLPKDRSYFSREELEAAHGADPADLAKVKDFAHEHGLDVTEESVVQRRVVLSGTVGAFSAAFGVELANYEHPGGTYRGRTGPIKVPAELRDVVQGVFGLDDRAVARPHFRGRLVQPHTGGISYAPPQLAGLYDFPTGGNGQGQCIAIIELGGGYRIGDLKTYFAGLNLPMPKISAVSVDGAHNKPSGNPNSADGEVVLDIEVAGAVAPGARIVVYFAPNTDKGFLDAIKKAIYDRINKPSVISISWGGPENGWTNQSAKAFEQAFQDAAALGVTVCCASGDSGSSDGENDGLQHVDFPASGPHALGCGGTRLEASGHTINSEVVWNEPTGGATGGGISDVFDPPPWQAGTNVPPSANPGGRVGRGVPDVAGDADPATGYQILVDGHWSVFGGTSAVAPLWAGLIALINQNLGQPVGYLNPLLYKFAAEKKGVFHDITTGDNGAYKAGSGWDACTGLGTPDGAKLLEALRGS